MGFSYIDIGVQALPHYAIIAMWIRAVCIYVHDEHILKRMNYTVKLAAKELKLNVGWQVVIFSDLLWMLPCLVLLIVTSWTT